MKKNVPPHSDTNFFTSFHRYLLIDEILASTSWDQMKQKISKFNVQNFSVWEGCLFKEFQLYNLSLELQILITDALMGWLISSKLLNKSDNDILKFFVERLIWKKKFSEDRATKLLKKESDNSIRGLLNPHCLLYVLEYSFGELVLFLEKNTRNFDLKNDLITNLNEFKKARNLLIHNVLSSRVSYSDDILEAGFVAGKRAQKIIKDCHPPLVY